MPEFGLELRPLAGRQDAVELVAELLHVRAARLRIGVLIRLAQIFHARHNLLLLLGAQMELVQRAHEVAAVMVGCRSRRCARGRWRAGSALRHGGERK